MQAMLTEGFPFSQLNLLIIVIASSNARGLWSYHKLNLVVDYVSTIKYHSSVTLPCLPERVYRITA